jgi:hypothetical protein
MFARVPSSRRTKKKRSVGECWPLRRTKSHVSYRWSSLSEETRRRPRALRPAHLVSFGISRAYVEMAVVGARGAPALVARAAGARVAPRRASPTGSARSAPRARRVAPRAAKTELETPSTTAGDPASVESGDAFDDPVATQFKAMYATPGKRIKWGVFKEDVGPAAAAVSESASRAARDAAASSLTNIDGDERARRGVVGRVFAALTIAIATAQVATHQPASARALIALPLFFAVGFLGSEKTGL